MPTFHREYLPGIHLGLSHGFRIQAFITKVVLRIFHKRYSVPSAKKNRRMQTINGPHRGVHTLPVQGVYLSHVSIYLSHVY